VLTVGLAVLVLILVAVGLRAAGGRTTSTDIVEVPARRDSVVPTSDPSRLTPSTSAPVSPSTTDPTGGAGTSTTLPKVDTVTPRVKVSDADGRFGIVVPRTWLNLPTSMPDQNQWEPLAQQPNGTLVETQFLFAVRWAASGGCSVDRCAAEVVDRLKAAFPGVDPTTAPDSIGGLQAVRIEAATTTQRLVAWVVVKGDRYWVPQLRGPPDEFDPVLAVVQPVVQAMSFG